MARAKHRTLIDQLLAEPFPQEWESWLSQNLRHYRLLSDAERERLRNDARVLVAEKSWEGCDGLKLTEEWIKTVGFALLKREYERSPACTKPIERRDGAE